MIRPQLNAVKERLYKYRSLNALPFLIDIIKNKELYAAPFTDLNDPMEGFYNTSERIMGHIRDEIYNEKRQHRICSLSKTWNNMLMWSHYADSHRGVVLGVKPTLTDDVMKKDVVYTTSLEVDGSGRSPRELAREVLTKKLNPWIYEKEVRILTSETFVPIEIEEVLIGCNAKLIDVERIKFIFGTTIDSSKIRQLERNELDVNSGNNLCCQTSQRIN